VIAALSALLACHAAAQTLDIPEPGSCAVASGLTDTVPIVGLNAGLLKTKSYL